MDDPYPSASLLLQRQINTLESRQLRALRELALGDAAALSRVQAIDSQICSLRTQLTPET